LAGVNEGCIADMVLRVDAMLGNTKPPRSMCGDGRASPAPLWRHKSRQVGGAVQARERKSSPKSQRRRSWSMVRCVEKSRDGRFSGAQIGSPPCGVSLQKTRILQAFPAWASICLDTEKGSGNSRCWPVLHRCQDRLRLQHRGTEPPALGMANTGSATALLRR